MKDLVPKGTGNSRFLRSSIPENITHEELVALLRAGTFPVDFAGLNPDGIATQGSAYNKANVLPDSTCSILELPTSAEPKSAFEHAALPEYSLRIGDIILTERSMPSYFLPADGRRVAQSAYPKLFDVVGYDYGFGRVISKTLSLTSGESTVGVSINVNDDGVFAVIVDTDGYSRYEDVYIGKLTSSEGEIIKTYTKPSGYTTYRASVVFGDDYIYLIQYSSDKYVFRILDASGSEIATDTNGVLNNGFDDIQMTWSDGALYIFTYIRGSSMEIYKLNSPNKIGYTKAKSLPNNNFGTNPGIGVCNGHYFYDDLRDGTTYTIGGVSSSGNIRGIQQNADGSLYILVYRSSAIYVYKTTNGTTFSSFMSFESITLSGGFWHIDSDGVHFFKGSASEETWYRTNGSKITAPLSYTIQETDDRDIIPMSIKSSDGFIVPCTKSGSISLMLISYTAMFQLPNLSSLKPTPYIKAKGSMG